MPAENYADNQKAPLTERLRQAQTAYSSGSGESPKKYYGSKGMPRHLALSEKGMAGAEKEAQRKLARLQNSAPKLAQNLAKGKKRAASQFVFRLFSQIDLTTDWLFFLLFSFAFLKDIFDIVFAAAEAATIGTIIFGAAMAAIGMTVSFVGNLMFLILTVTVLVLVGGSLKNRGFAKYILGVAMEFIAEALPGISMLPWTVIYVFILYLCVLYDRAFANQGKQSTAEQPAEEKNEQQNIPASGTAADGYQDRLAA